MNTDTLYRKNIREIKQVTLAVNTFYANGKQVCLSWYGCDNHPREACQFLMTAHFGMVYLCGLTGDKLPHLEHDFTVVPDTCPLKKGDEE